MKNDLKTGTYVKVIGSIYKVYKTSFKSYLLLAPENHFNHVCSERAHCTHKKWKVLCGRNNTLQCTKKELFNNLIESNSASVVSRLEGLLAVGE